jgi:hypothetical protein
MLKLAELSVLAMVAKMPMIAHLLARTLHTFFKRCSSRSIAGWQRLIEPQACLVVISIFLLFVRLWGRRNGHVGLADNTGFSDRGCNESVIEEKSVSNVSSLFVALHSRK